MGKIKQLQIAIDSSGYELLSGALDRLDADGSRARPEVLFHYTSVESFTKILGSGTLFASHSGFLNDRTEFRWLGTVAREEIRSRLAALGGALTNPNEAQTPADIRRAALGALDAVVQSGELSGPYV
jgi:hypothetical protein